MELVFKESWQSIRLFICQQLLKHRLNLLSVNYILKINKQDFPGGPGAKTLCCQFRGPGFNSWLQNQIPHATDTGLISGLRRSPGGGNGNPPQHSSLENFMQLEEPGRLQFMG